MFLGSSIRIDKDFAKAFTSEISTGNCLNCLYAFRKSPLRRRVERVQSRDHSQSTGFRFLCLTAWGFESPRSHFVLALATSWLGPLRVRVLSVPSGCKSPRSHFGLALATSWLGPLRVRVLSVPSGCESPARTPLLEYLEDPEWSVEDFDRLFESRERLSKVAKGFEKLRVVAITWQSCEHRWLGTHREAV